MHRTSIYLAIVSQDSMGRIDAVITDELETEFRKEVSMSLGMKKGNLSLALEEAITEWVTMRRTKRRDAAKKSMGG